MWIATVELLIGLSAGLATGAGFVAFLTVLGIIPRLVQLSKTQNFLISYEAGVTAGAFAGTILSFHYFHFHAPTLLITLWGLLHGIFVGMLAAALTEVLNVFPILTRRIGLDSSLIWFFMAIVLGKITGSLFQWLLLSY
ncbi:stage V sporulation protein AB [Terribacillus saccharophilus]|jgi:stage V sporulation protein AB|uniref:Stage V sporulation protein AB n=1 Tax=Terribacillus saccharophilus TaxID=361277 RepID=A0A268HG83_9BACI|nr:MULTISPECIES: stage V sporulation protein AB [Terribacillus]PAD36819.1 stage V sporulation protein AB [Terribacillus saccharophilus]PAD97802.1 stage V sporulation protein AB [Terribacillus saccharophilus]PAE01184.1 stage V sporulation protein AB [Terribacillus saccharophilus]PAE08845.1 stage V sporulation protein AB [Terribacillus saccharophilus]VVM32218.1 Stage V sporulation protein AB (SpoVAB) [Terribacillus sp. AE2B 122]